MRWYASEGGLELSVIRAIRHRLFLMDSYENLMKRIKSTKRLRKFRWQIKKLNENYNVEVQNFSADEIDEKLISRVWEIQKASWMFRRGGANIGRQDIRELLKSLSKHGLLRAWIMTLDGDDAAMVINYESH